MRCLFKCTPVLLAITSIKSNLFSLLKLSFFFAILIRWSMLWSLTSLICLLMLLLKSLSSNTSYFIDILESLLFWRIYYMFICFIKLVYYNTQKISSLMSILSLLTLVWFTGTMDVLHLVIGLIADLAQLMTDLFLGKGEVSLLDFGYD